MIDYIGSKNGSVVAGGSIAQTLLANNLDVNCLRTNDILLKEEWKEYDGAVLQAAQDRLVGVADLMGRGLVYNLKNGFGTTILETQAASDFNEAEVDMSGVTRGKNDRQTFELEQFPLPIIHKDFQLDIRTLNASRKLEQSLDTSQAALSSAKVADKQEEILFVGSTVPVVGSNVIYGYTNHPDRNIVALPLDWDDASKTGELILADVQNMKVASLAVKKYGPFMLYIPQAYETVVDNDFKAHGDLTTRDRILKLNKIIDVKVADKMPADNLILAQFSPDVVRMVNAVPLTVIQWQSEGGMVFHFKVLTINVPQIRSNKADECGVTHMS